MSPLPTVLGLEVPPFRLNGRRFGVELEFVGGDWEAIEWNLQSAGLDASIESEDPLSQWDVKDEESVMGGEVTSPPLSGKQGAREVALAVRAMKRAGAEVDRECGLHVHHDVADLDSLNRLLDNYRESQTAFDMLVGRYRRSDSYNSFCRPLTRYRDSRYCVVNPYRTWHGTAEFRQHEGTLDAHEILAWVVLGQALIAVSKDDGAIAERTVEGLLDSLGEHLDSATSEFLLDRKKALQGNSRLVLS